MDLKRSISLFCLLLGGVGLAIPASGQWVQRFNGTGNGNDQATAIAMDSQGNVYVTGGSIGTARHYGYLTVKYDVSGNQLWAHRFNGSGGGNDIATALAVDGNGNVYVTGGSVGSAGNYDYATFKYNANGTTLWGHTYNGTGNGDDQATAIGLDSKGNVYITGYSTGKGTGYDCLTMKYDTNGNLLWTRRFNGIGNGDDIPNALAVDSGGNVYVTGSSTNSKGGLDYVIIKYDTNGNTVWGHAYNGPANGVDVANAIAVDIQGNVYVAGQSTDAAGYYDYLTMKYDTRGNLLWTRRYNGSGVGDSVATALALDSQGNVYVTGYSYEQGTGFDYVTFKYDTADGHTIWSRSYNGPGNGDDVAFGIGVDALGNAYVTGYSVGQGTDYDYATLKYDTNGHQKWTQRYNGDANSTDIATAIAVDSKGDVAVTGYSLGQGTGYDYATIFYGR